MKTNPIFRAAVDNLKPRILAHLADPARGKTTGHMKFRFGLDSKRHIASGHSEGRVLDKALQELRKANKIVFVGSQWRLIDPAQAWQATHTFPTCEHALAEADRTMKLLPGERRET